MPDSSTIAGGLPATIPDVQTLDDLLSAPPAGLGAALVALGGDILMLGVAGKMGPTFARMAQRALAEVGSTQRVIGVSRFSNPDERQRLDGWGIRTITCDLLDRAQLAALPEAPNVLYLAGRKFGSTGQEHLTWAMNAHLPALVAERYARSRIVALSTGNVYGLTRVAGGGSRETDALHPDGEYSMSCLGRERLFEYFSRTLGTKVALMRLNYACELRYGVLVDIAQKVWAGAAVPVDMGWFNVIWQGDACAMILRAFAHVASPPRALNVTGPEALRVRDVAAEFGRLMGKPAHCTGQEQRDAALSQARHVYPLLGEPRVTPAELMRPIAAWVMRGGPTLGKPTHFEVRDGKY